MRSTSKIYVAGHLGLVGSALMRTLHNEGYHNIIVRSPQELDLRNQKNVHDFFRLEKPEYVFLAAAKVGGILANNTYKAEFIYDNLMIATNVIHAAYVNQATKLINLGSSCIYPKHTPQPIKEEQLLTGALENTNEPYAIAKIAAIKLCRFYNEQYGTNFISLMPTNLYGPHDNFNLETAHVLPALLRKMHLAKCLATNNWPSLIADIKRYPLGYGYDASLNFTKPETIIDALEKLGITKTNITIWGTGKPFREFLDVDSLAHAALFAMCTLSTAQAGECLNVGSGTEIQINQLANLIRDIVGFSGDIIFDTTKPDGTPRKLIDISRIKNLGWSTKTELATEIQATYAWYLEQDHCVAMKKKENIHVFTATQ